MKQFKNNLATRIGLTTTLILIMAGQAQADLTKTLTFNENALNHWTVDQFERFTYENAGGGHRTR
ncbi:MAG: hypothetical protein K9N22_08700 [Candidatus Marinimicrobia bacterium]|nr:hypothetical protein [Candidatus Neomarinimicrobiota bacterium]